MAVQTNTGGRSTRRLKQLGLAGSMATILVAGVAAAPGQAASSYTVPIPLHPAEASLHLIGASEFGVAVQQGDSSNLLGPNRRVHTGALGGELTFRPEVGPGFNDQTPPTRR